MGVTGQRHNRFTPGNDPAPNVREGGWVPSPVWTAAENLPPIRIQSPDRPSRSKPLHRRPYHGPSPVPRTICKLRHEQCMKSSLFFIPLITKFQNYRAL